MTLPGLTNTVSLPLIDNVAQGFSGFGDFSGVLDNAAQTLGASATAPMEGQMYYDAAAGGVYRFTNGQWVLGNGDVANTGGSNGGGSSAPSYNNDDLAYLNDQEAELNKQKARTQTGLDQGLTNLETSYTGQKGTAEYGREKALRDYGIQRADTTAARQKSVGMVEGNARSLSDSVRRILGMSAGNSSAKGVAGDAIARKTSIERNNVEDNYGRNFRNLDNAEGDAKVSFETLLADLAKQKQDKEFELRSGITGQRDLIDQNLANVGADRTKLQGGGYGATRVAQQPYKDAINGRQTELDALFSKFSAPTFTPKAADVKQVNLQDYTVNRANIGGKAQSAADPYGYAAYLNKKKEGVL